MDYQKDEDGVTEDVDKIEAEKGKDSVVKGKPPEKGVKPGDSKDIEDVLKGTKKAEKKLKPPSPPKDKADILYDEYGGVIGQKEVEISKDKGSKDIVKEGGGIIYDEYGEKVGYQETEIGKDKGSKDKGKEGVKIPFDNKLQEKVGKGVTPSGDGESTDKAKKGITTLLDGTFTDKLNTDVGLDNVSEVDKVDIQVEKQKRTGMEIKRIGKMIGQGKPISEIQGAWTAFIKGVEDAKAIMPAINGVLLEAIQEALKNAQPDSFNMEPLEPIEEYPETLEPMEPSEPSEPMEIEEEYEAVAIADVAKMLYYTVVANRGKDLPPDWYSVEAETSLELPKISAPPLDIEKQKLPTIKPPKVIKMPKTVERPRPVEIPRPPAAEKPPTAKGPEAPGRPEAGGTGRPSGGRQ